MREPGDPRIARLCVASLLLACAPACSGSDSPGAPASEGGGGAMAPGSGGGPAVGAGGTSPGLGGMANGGSAGNGTTRTGGGTVGAGGASSPPGTGGTASSGGAASGGAGGVAPTAPEGDVHVVKRMGDPSFDAVVTNPSPSTVTWLDDHFYRMEVFTTFFDGKTSFYPNGWVYSDSQVIYPGSSTATSHPDWILKDAAGHSVYLDWNCSKGSCPQYAADVSNPDFRASWIAALKSALAKGYRGAWIDDVNLALRFSDGSKSVTAHSPATSTVMTEDTWSAAVASFMTEIRAAIPSYELLHNSIWYARPTRTADARVQEEIQAADVINMEGGFASDGGLTGGTAEWSVSAKMGFADAVHAAGKWVVVDDFPSNDAEREYALACYLLLANGKDGLGDNTMAPTTWWKGYDVHLGPALGARTRNAAGVFRREFQRGVVLMLEPGASPANVTLPAPYVTVNGTEVTEVHLTAKQGAVLVAK